MSLAVIETWLLDKGLSILGFVWKLILCFVVYMIVTKLVKYLCKILRKNMERFRVESEVINFVNSVVKYGILALTILSIVVQLGVEASSIAALIASAGVGISLALQGGLSNFAGGILILFLKPFREGDYIICQSQDVEGSVKKIEMYYTTITTYDNRIIKVPNANLTNNTLVNTTAMERRKLEVVVGVSYHTDLVKAKLILKELVDTDIRFQEEDKQFFVASLEESSVQIGFRAWVATGDYFQTKWDMLEKIKLRFDEEGIEIPYNQLDVHVTQN